MRMNILGLVAAGLLAGPVTASADSISGDWAGMWAGNGITATFDMQASEDGTGAFTGSFNWTCLSGITCSGIENFAGNDTGTTFTFATTSFEPGYVNLGSAVYSGAFTAGGISGTDSSGGQWSATRVPEPATLGLLGLGLAGIGAMRRRRSA